ncbi:MAG: DoxX family protein [Sphingobacteriales bacterium 17-39-43]|uniref:DoxX family protein n=1 Tax=Daejeonella sp. TaxID=2805397 RepID=UPI000BDCF158|nr:DoxX family protein [Daejeonella sp.]OYZ29841.1 MAG: DoxX family protein [Sphingobacteriales bacterium 16-39-50]OZA22685.1 MAG: DoxX family protein [Sphingobacteriales bacterium 17-39-43]HQT24340.1 DoxX family protein [Daejeonella sp.]HQT59133.1 DoxX family protein [Daejeonella sp.]
MKSPFLSSAPLANDLGLLFLRVVSGAVMLTHGYPKFQKILEGNLKFGDPVGLGQVPSLYLSTFAEFLCAILVIIGLYTRLSLIPLIINMSVAFFIAHAADDFGTKEKSLLFLGMFIVLFLTGSGRFSIDNKINK